MIIALDPGITTGVCLYDPETRAIETTQICNTHKHFWNYLEDIDPEIIVYERFVYQRRPNVELYPVEVIGVIKLFASVSFVDTFIQTPSQAMNLITDDKLKQMALWVEGQKHGMDALRHMLYYLIITKGEREWLTKLRPDS